MMRITRVEALKNLDYYLERSKEGEPVLVDDEDSGRLPQQRPVRWRDSSDLSFMPAEYPSVPEGRLIQRLIDLQG